MKHILGYKLYESPDQVIYGRTTKKTLEWNADNAQSFGYRDNKMYIAKNHVVMLNQLPIEEVEKELYLDPNNPFDDDLIDRVDFNEARRLFKYSGRIWTEPDEIISFWDYPTRSNLTSILSSLADALSISYLTIYHNYSIELPNELSTYGKFTSVKNYKAGKWNTSTLNMRHLILPILK